MFTTAIYSDILFYFSINFEKLHQTMGKNVTPAKEILKIIRKSTLPDTTLNRYKVLKLNRFSDYMTIDMFIALLRQRLALP